MSFRMVCTTECYLEVILDDDIALCELYFLPKFTHIVELILFPAFP